MMANFSMVILGGILFGYKLSQTSNFALRHSESAYYEMGLWAIGIFFILLISFVCLILYGKGVNNMKKLSEALIEKLSLLLTQSPSE